MNNTPAKASTARCNILDRLIMLAIVLAGVSGCMNDAWRVTLKSDTVAAYEDFLQRYPQCEFSQTAAQYLLFSKAKQTDTIEAYEGFLSHYPLDPWNAKIKKEMDAAAQGCETNPVVSFLVFQAAIKQSSRPVMTSFSLTRPQLAWLYIKTKQLRQPALAMLQADFKQASEANYYRGAYFAQVIAAKIDKAYTDTYMSLQDLEAKTCSEKATGIDIWTISSATGVFIDKPFVERNPFFIGQGPRNFTLKPKLGYRFLQVTATVRNTSSVADCPYAIWAMSDIKRCSSLAETTKNDAPYFWLDDSHIDLLTPESRHIPCSLVCDGCPLKQSILASAWTSTGNFLLVTKPERVYSNTEMSLKLLFTVPNHITDYRLFVLGSKPVNLTITKSDSAAVVSP